MVALIRSRHNIEKEEHMLDLLMLVVGTCLFMVAGLAVCIGISIFCDSINLGGSFASIADKLIALAQSALALLFPGPGRLDADRFAASLIGGIASGLGGRFFDELREKQSLCYTVQTYLSERWRAGAFVAYIATAPEKEKAARDGLLKEFAKLRENGVTAQELERAQTYAVGAHQIRMQSGGVLLGEMVDAWMFGSLAELDQVDDRIRAVTREDILRVARRDFDPDRRVEAIIRGVTR